MNIQSLSREELLAVLAAARRKRERDWLMVLVAFVHGLRATEVISLTRDNFHDGFLDIQRLKGSERTIQALHVSENPLLNEHQAVFEYIAGLHQNERLFKVTRQRFFQLMREHGKAAGIPRHKAHPHALKHTTGAQMIERESVDKVRQRLGHKSLSSTGAYLKVSDAAADAAFARALND